MIPLTLADVAELCPGRLETRPGADRITGVQIDSRRISEGDLFVAVRGGVDFAADALGRGAAAALVPDDAFQALAALGQAVRSRSPARFVGITGSWGKTSTKDILAALCNPHGRTIAAEASYNAELGVPLTLCRLEENTEICIVELAMRDFGQIAELAQVARPEIGVITSIGPVHLEFMGSIEGVVRAKAELIEALPVGGTAIVPSGMPALDQYLDRGELDVVLFGPGGDVQLVRFERLDDRSFVEADVCGERVSLDAPLTARHHAENMLPALAAYRALGLPLSDVARGAAEIRFSRLRGEEVPLPGGGVLINDCWNASPVTMMAALQTLVERAEGRRTVAVLGEMAELGQDGPRYHVQVGERVKELGIDVLVGVGPLARGYLMSGSDRWAESVRDGIAELEAVLRPGDCVLVKGSRKLGLEAVAEALTSVHA